jgi:glycosyltransferase involved in cell wall biosynthesis
VKVLHLTKINFTEVSGPAKSTVELCSNLNQIKGLNITQLNLLNSKPKNSYDHLFVHTKNIKKIIKLIKANDLFVFHSYYIIEFLFIGILIKFFKKKYVIVPRGALNKSAQKIKPLKKIIGNLIFNVFLKFSHAIQYLTYNEKDNSINKSKKSVVIPNGIQLKNETVTNHNNDKIFFTYIGRLDVWHKGLDLLIESFDQVSKENISGNAIELNLYGNFVRDSEEKIKYLVKEASNIYVHSAVFNKVKEDILLKSNFFIQTSRFEGLPMGVLEALSYGLPCILTEGTNFSNEVRDYSAGYNCQNSTRSIKNAIFESINENNYMQKSKNAKILASSFNWSKISQKSFNLYKECLK